MISSEITVAEYLLIRLKAIGVDYLFGVAGAFAERVPVLVITGSPATLNFRTQPLLHHKKYIDKYGQNIPEIRN